jgi:hypothetical protein
MKAIAFALFILSLGATEANAAACAAGPYRAGCVGPHGAVGVHRGVVAPGYRGAVVRPVVRPVARPYGVACVWRAGVRICR